MPTDSGQRIAAIKRFVVDMANDAWNADGKALLLARLGQALAKHGYNLKEELRGERLAAFVTRELANEVRILTSPSDSLVQGLIPAGKELEADVSRYFERTGDASRDFAGSRVLFNRKLWAAFSRPLRQGLVRAVELKPEVRFFDIEESGTSGRLVIPEDLIVPFADSFSSERNGRIYQNILKWVTDNGIDPELVHAKVSGTEPHSTCSESILSLLLEALDRSELERIAMPLDIVAKLHGKRAKLG